MLGIPVWIGIGTGALLPIGLFSVEYRVEMRSLRRATAHGATMWWTLTPQRKVRNFETGAVEPRNEEIDFDPRHGHYMKCGEIITTLASASLVFLPTLRFSSVLPWLGFPMVLLGFTVVYALAFMGLLTYFYEMQLQNPDTFTAARSCGLFSLGFGGLASFAIAYFSLSIMIGNALSHGAFVGAGR